MIDPIRLYTNKRFVENVRLYGRLGYQLDREEEVGDAIAVHMNKDLSLQLAGLTES